MAKTYTRCAKTDETTDTPGSVPRGDHSPKVTAIHLDDALPHRSSSLPGHSTSSVIVSCLALLQVGFT